MQKPRIIAKAYRANERLTYGETRAKAKWAAIRAADCFEQKDAMEYYNNCRRDPEFDLIENTPHELSGTISEEQRKNMVHALGERPDGHGFTGHRNRYITYEDAGWEDLVVKGFAVRRDFQIAGGRQEYIYSVTELGEKVLGSLYPVLRFKVEHPAYVEAD